MPFDLVLCNCLPPPILQCLFLYYNILASSSYNSRDRNAVAKLILTHFTVTGSDIFMGYRKRPVTWNGLMLHCHLLKKSLMENFIFCAVLVLNFSKITSSFMHSDICWFSLGTILVTHGNQTFCKKKEIFFNVTNSRPPGFHRLHLLYHKCDALRDLVPFVHFKKREKHPLRSVNFLN